MNEGQRVKVLRSTIPELVGRTGLVEAVITPLVLLNVDGQDYIEHINNLQVVEKFQVDQWVVCVRVDPRYEGQSSYGVGTKGMIVEVQQEPGGDIFYYIQPPDGAPAIAFYENELEEDTRE